MAGAAAWCHSLGRQDRDEIIEQNLILTDRTTGKSKFENAFHQLQFMFVLT